MIGDRLKALRKAANLTQQQVGDRIGIAKNSVSEWENNKGQPTPDKIPVLARIFRTTTDYILTGKDDFSASVSNIEDGPDIRGMVPLISDIQAGMWTDIKERFLMKDAIETIPTTRKLSRFAFAVRVVGDSMFQPGNPKSLVEGQIAIVDPEIEPQHRDIVVASMVSGDQPMGTIKQLIQDGSERILSPLNPNYKPIVMSPGMTISGVVMDVLTRFR